MKAADLKTLAGKKPPHTFVLAPRAFSEAWRARPTAPLRVGMRVASADERLLAHTRAVKEADKLLTDGNAPPSRDSAAWRTTYDIVRFHVLLSFTLTDPDDVDKPLWPNQEGAGLAFAKAPLGTAVISPRFSVVGLERVYFELEALTVTETSKILWQPIGDRDARAMAAEVQAGTFFSSISTGEGPPETADARRLGIEEQIRRLLAYVKHLHDTGIAPSPMDS